MNTNKDFAKKDAELLASLPEEQQRLIVELADKMEVDLDAMSPAEKRAELLNARAQFRDTLRKQKRAVHYRELADELTTVLDEADTIQADDGTVGPEDAERYAALIGRAYSIASRIRLGLLGVGGVEAVASFDVVTDWKWIEVEHRRISEWLVERNRTVRILTRERRRLYDELAGSFAEASRTVEQLCSSCHRRPRHFDDLCKRCANDQGVRPKGKIA